MHVTQNQNHVTFIELDLPPSPPWKSADGPTPKSVSSYFYCLSVPSIIFFYLLFNYFGFSDLLFNYFVFWFYVIYVHLNESMCSNTIYLSCSIKNIYIYIYIIILFCCIKMKYFFWKNIEEVAQSMKSQI